ncbi:hypothetical protein [Streptomyces sp. NPDC093261]|uniref:hypothetical protein n=1 Tax=Streptomyces sp. NPDC093261 TaxID=3366037 RepID=UPI003808C7C5
MTDATVRTLPVQGAVPTLPLGTDLRSLIPECDQVSHPIRYGDRRWEFEGYPLVNQTVRYIDFSAVPARWLYTVQDWLLLRLNPILARTGESGLDTTDVMADSAAAERRLRVPSGMAYVHGLGESLRVLDGLPPHLRPDYWQTFAQRLRVSWPKATASSLAGYARPLTSVWRYRGLLRLPQDLFGGRPFDGQTVESLFGVPDRLANRVGPDAGLCGPLLGLSLWMLDHIADDVIARLEVLATVPDRSGLPREEQYAAVRDLLLQYEETGRPLPGMPHLRGGGLAPGWAVFTRLAGVDRALCSNPKFTAAPVWERLKRTRAVDAAEDGFALPIATVPTLDGERVRWVDSLPPTKFKLGLDHWSSALAYACALVITMLTTVRERELAALPHDCLRQGSYDRGDIKVPVTYMRGYLVKNRDEPQPATWVVADDVVRAVHVLHRLKTALRLEPRLHPLTGTEVLLHPGLGRSLTGDKKAETLTLAYGWLRWFRASGAHLASRGLVPALPDLPAWLAHRTLRITAIDAYASREYGDALAARQAHWSSRRVAEGYLAHLPRNVFLADPGAIAEAGDQARVTALLEAAADLQTDPDAFAGKGAHRLSQFLDDSGATSLATGPVTQKQVTALARESQGKIFVGELTFCVFGPGGLCGSEAEADFTLCRPGACGNSATSVAHRARMELRRRAWSRPGVFDRARRKIEQDNPGLAAEFAHLDDAALRHLLLDTLPTRYASAARGAASDATDKADEPGETP